MATNRKKPQAKTGSVEAPIKVSLAPMIDLLSTVRDHGKLGELRAQAQASDLQVLLGGDHLAALRSFVSDDSFMSRHPVGRAFLDAIVGQDGDLGFHSWG